MRFAISRRVAAIVAMTVLAAGSAGAAPTCGAPGWLHAPSAGDLDAAYPAKAHAAGVTGRAALLCALRPSGSNFAHALPAMVNKGWLTAGPADPSAPTPADGVWRFSVVLAPHRF
jgi:hypothetical protein